MIKEAVVCFCENTPFNPTAAGGQQTRRLKLIAITSEPQEVFNETSWLLLKIIYVHFRAKKNLSCETRVLFDEAIIYLLW